MMHLISLVEVVKPLSFVVKHWAVASIPAFTVLWMILLSQGPVFIMTIACECDKNH